MKTKYPLRAVFALSAVLLVSCAGVDFDQDNLAYLDAQIAQLPIELLESDLVLDAEGNTLIETPLTVGEFLVLMVASDPLMRNSWLSANVTSSDEGAVINLKIYNRGKLVLVNSIELVYQKAMKESRVASITWDDKLMGEKVEFVSLEDKVGYALLLATYVTLQ